MWSTRCHENFVREGENQEAADPPCWGEMGCHGWLGGGMGLGFTSPALHPGMNCPDEPFGVKTARPGSAGSSLRERGSSIADPL